MKFGKSESYFMFSSCVLNEDIYIKRTFLPSNTKSESSEQGDLTHFQDLRFKSECFSLIFECFFVKNDQTSGLRKEVRVAFPCHEICTMRGAGQ